MKRAIQDILETIENIEIGSVLTNETQQLSSLLPYTTKIPFTIAALFSVM